jgi:4'-phosphopantetheinyl transferase
MEKADRQLKWSAAGPNDFQSRVLPLHAMDPPGPGVAHLWILDLASLGASLQHALAGERDDSTPELTAQQSRFVRRFYLKLLLGAYLGIPGKSVRINRSSRGKPALDRSAHQSDLQFSLAKSGNQLLIGLSSKESIGVDLEPCCRTARDALGLARRYFSPSESAALEQMDSDNLDEAFLHTWACKEAVVKASGHGIANQFNCFTVNTDPQHPPALLDMDDEEASSWQIRIIQPDKELVAAVASRQKSLKLETFRMEKTRL